jgi:surface antigen
MKATISRIGMAAFLVVGLAACAAPEDRHPGQVGEANKTTGGTLLGALGGGLLGSQIGGGTGKLIAVGAGTLLGAFIGHQVGESLDKADANYARGAQDRAHAAPIGQQISWSNPESGHSGTITPRREGNDSAGNYCREYQQTVTVGGKTEQAYGTACRQPDGSWKVVSN